MKKVLIIGIGNEYRNDDAIGLLVIEDLKNMGIPDVVFMKSRGDYVEIAEKCQSFDKIIMIDSVFSGSKPGTIFELDSEELMKTKISFPKYSSHDFSIVDFLKTSEIMQIPIDKIKFFGIEGESFGFGTKISEPVMRAARQVKEKIIYYFQKLRKSENIECVFR